MACDFVLLSLATRRELVAKPDIENEARRAADEFCDELRSYCRANKKFRALQLHDRYSNSQCVRSNV